MNNSMVFSRIGTLNRIKFAYVAYIFPILHRLVQIHCEGKGMTMKKDVRDVRKSIAKRRKEKNMPEKPIPSKSFVSSLPENEEKHGYLPFTPTVEGKKKPKEAFVASFMMKSILAAALFFGVAVINGTDLSWTETPKQWTSQALTEEFPFATVNKWYQDKFGSPLALTPKESEQANGEAHSLPVSGTVSESFKANGEGIMITTDEKSEVAAMKEGTVIFAGNDSETNKTVIIQHADQSKSIYGHLSSINVHQYQSVSDNDIIGEFIPADNGSQTVYFAIQKDNEFIDPVQVMQVDESQ